MNLGDGFANGFSNYYGIMQIPGTNNSIEI